MAYPRRRWYWGKALVCLIGSLVLPNAANATALATVEEFTIFGDAGEVPFTGTFNRTNEYRLLVPLRLTIGLLNGSLYLPSHGDTWNIRVLGQSVGVITDAAISYDANTDCLYNARSGSPTRGSLCNLTTSLPKQVPNPYNPATHDRVRTVTTFVELRPACLDEANGYQITLTFSANRNPTTETSGLQGCLDSNANEPCAVAYSPAAGSHLGASPYALRFTGSSLQPPILVVGKFSRVLAPNIPAFPRNRNDRNYKQGIINPESPAEDTDLFVVPLDQCSTEVTNAEVEIVSTVNREMVISDFATDSQSMPSAGHLHFGNAIVPGKGTFIADDRAEQPSTIVSSSAETSARGKANADGTYYIRYKAGRFGLGENLTTSARIGTQEWVPAREREVIATGFGNFSSFLSPGFFVSNYLPLRDRQDLNFIVRGSGSTCDLFHARSASDPFRRHSSYVDSFMFTRLQALATIFYERTGGANGGIKLSYNDGSLPLGGEFDGQSCGHVTHRFGRDIDVNVGGTPADCPSAYNLKCPHGLRDRPLGETRLDLLTDIVENTLGGKRMIEGPVHYRFLDPEEETP